MNCSEAGALIKKRRTELGLTQKALADKMNISDKTVSKWERGLGFPDVNLISELAEILSVSIESLIMGKCEQNEFKEINMKNNVYYICRQCGSITVSTGKAEITCCGEKLEPAEPKKAAEEQKLTVSPVENEWLVTGDCPMTKEDYVSFAAFVTAETIYMIKLYPEWDLCFRLPCRTSGKLLWYSKKQGLLFQYVR
ncbi:MAG: helix-turn-helix domain-containing protein [Huintestinicola sp.]|uniref:helix-turn-helix domain-containing protein n=1 Tax=Huintestinicola sp. TaxID=2981661 RepID=UPI003F00C21D